MLLDVGFKEREGLALLQEVNSAVPYQPAPMLGLALAFAYTQDIERAIIVMKDCAQRFRHVSPLCYVFLAHFRAQEIIQRDAEDDPLIPEFHVHALDLKDPDHKDMEVIPVFKEKQVWEIELLMNKAAVKLLHQHGLTASEQGISTRSVTQIALASQTCMPQHYPQKRYLSTSKLFCTGPSC